MPVLLVPLVAKPLAVFLGRESSEIPARPLPYQAIAEGDLVSPSGCVFVAILCLSLVLQCYNMLCCPMMIADGNGVTRLYRAFLPNDDRGGQRG